MIFIFLCSFILFISINLSVNIKIDFDVLNNNGKLSIKLFRYLFLLSNDFKIKGEFIEIKRKNKLVKINLKISKKQLRFLKELNKNLLSKIYFSNIFLSSKFKLNNPFNLAILSSIYKSFLSVILIKFKSVNYDCGISNKTFINFDNNAILIDFDGTIYFSIFDIIWAFIVTLIIDRRKNNEERRTKTKC